jgi:hypothetical protein
MRYILLTMIIIAILISAANAGEENYINCKIDNKLDVSIQYYEGSQDYGITDTFVKEPIEAHTTIDAFTSKGRQSPPSGTKGFMVYSIKGTKDYLKIAWDVPSVKGTIQNPILNSLEATIIALKGGVEVEGKNASNYVISVDNFHEVSTALENIMVHIGPSCKKCDACCPTPIPCPECPKCPVGPTPTVTSAQNSVIVRGIGNAVTIPTSTVTNINISGIDNRISINN